MKQYKTACYAAGVIGSSFAVSFALQEIPCNVYVTNEDRKVRGTAAIEKVLDSLVDIQAISKEKRDLCRKNILVTTDPAEAFDGVSLIQENGPEKLEIKQEILEVIEKYAPQDAVIASSTSGMPISQIAAQARHPERCIGAHPFNPPHLIPLVEITRGDRTEQSYIEKAVRIYREAKKEPVVLLKEKIGFIANRFSHAILREVMALINEGVCTPEDADRALVYGPGIRWASIGQCMVGELGTSGGVKEGMTRFAPLNAMIFRDLENLTEVPEGIPEKAEAGVHRLYQENPDCIGHTKEEVAAFRDKVLVEVLKLHGKL